MVEISSTTHNVDFKSNSKGKGSYNLINIVALSESSSSSLILLAITVLLPPKFKRKSTKYSVSFLYCIKLFVKLIKSKLEILVLSNLISVLSEDISFIK